MHTRTLSILLFILSAFCIRPATVSAQKKTKNEDAKKLEEIFSLINKHRGEMGLQAFKYNEAIAKVAEVHSKNMASKKVAFGHDGFEERITKLEKQLKKTRASAENVASSTRDAQSVVNMWLNSKGHRENIEGDYLLSGIGMAKNSEGQAYYTQIFITPARSN